MKSLTFSVARNQILIRDESEPLKVTTTIYECATREQALNLAHLLLAAKKACDWMHNRTLPAGSLAQDIAGELEHRLDRLTS